MTNTKSADRDTTTTTQKDGTKDATSAGTSGTDRERNTADKGGVEGEGSYSGAKQYNDATRRFVEQGKVEDAAAAAAPHNPAEARDMQAAEQAGKRKAKGEDPALRSGPDGTRDDEDVE